MIFYKNFVKLTFSLKSYTVDQFDENILQWGKIYEITTLCNHIAQYSVEKQKILSHQKYISSNQLFSNLFV